MIPFAAVRPKLIFPRSAGAAPSGTSWDPTQKSADINLTNSNLTATASATGFKGARTVASASSGKKYWEFSIVSGTGFIEMGIATAAWDFTSNFLGQGGSSFGCDNGGSFFGGAGAGTSFAAGNRCCLALDIGGRLLWLKNLDGTNQWNNDGSADPATGTLGNDVSALTPPFFAGVMINASGESLIANFDISSAAGAVPSGYGNW